uniref:Chromosome 1 open reading frame 198 n=1 Tax=Anas platyrhynchos platyrhynchos TaxID=8840 RepID=U3J2S2_ANAPP
MASMAAAIAASRTAVMNGNRPLDERERKRFSYFSSLSPMARKIMAEKERIRERYGPEWERLPPRQQDEIIDRCLVEPHVQARYAAHRGAARPPPPPSSYPSLRLNTGQKLVRFGDEDITWQDEHSAPFSWETKSQMEFSVASLSIQEQGGAQLQNEQRQPLKAAPGVQVPKPSQAAKTPGSDGLIAPRKDEESSFWKINAERSKFEGDKSEFQSLTPSQIKSMEKGEKPLPSFCRQESAPKEVVKAEKPSVTKPEKSVAPSLPSVSLEWEKPRPSQLPASSLDDFFLPDPPQYLASSRTNKEDNDGTILSDPQTPGQVRTAVSTILKFKNKYNTLKYDKVILEDQEFHKH